MRKTSFLKILETNNELSAPLSLFPSVAIQFKPTPENSHLGSSLKEFDYRCASTALDTFEGF